ncbi:MAG: membrane protein insertase YidC [Planctomycetes bacterium]|nr:membrane protein insertase YidC [Planctomycetota bacterium]MCB9902283.1 membrane protein insertase YidC [Planctomycetota bacterium]
MERRMLLAVVLSFVAVTAWTLLFPPQRTKPTPDPADGQEAPENPGGDPAADPGGPAAPANPGNPAPAAPGSDPAPAPGPANGGAHQPQADAPRVTVERESPELDVTFTSQGGGIESVSLRTALEPGVEKPLDLVVPADPHMLLGQSDSSLVTPTVAPGGADRQNETPGPERTLHWTHDTAMEAATPEDDVVFTFQRTDGIKLIKRWMLPTEERRYDISLKMSAVRTGDGPDALPVGLLVSSGMLREAFEGTFGSPSTIVVMRQGQDDVISGGQLVHGMPVMEIALEGIPEHLRVLGVHSNYFLTAFFADTINGKPSPISRAWATGEQGSLRPVMQARLLDWFKTARQRDATGDERLKKRILDGVNQMHHAWAVLQVPVAAAGTATPAEAEVRIFTGPSDRSVLAQDVYAPLRPVLTYPSAPDAVTRFLLWIYDLWRNLLGSAGLAVIFMTLTVRGGLMPLSIRNQLSMRRYSRKVAKVKPKLQQLQQKYAANPRKLREEQMKLYREHGIGFPSGCLMMVIQIPIFFALFSGLRTEYTLWGRPFAWIRDLAGPDKLIDFGRPLLDLGLFRFDAINILPILMVVISILHQRSMPKPADEQQAQQMRMMKWMPIFFAFLLYNYTAALALYMVFSALIGLIEARIVRAKDEAEVAAAAAAA